MISCFVTHGGFILAHIANIDDLLIDTLRVTPVVIGMAVQALTRIFSLELFRVGAHVRRFRVAVVEADESKCT